MSAEVRADDGSNVVEVVVSGKLEGKDYDAFLPAVERRIRAWGKIRVVCRLVDFHGWTLGGLWKDVKFDVRHYGHIERLAIVGDKRWEAGMAAICKPFTTAAVKYFDVADATHAAEWVREGVTVGV